MEPIALWTRSGGEWALVHRCARCAALRTNRIGGDDDALALLSLALRPLALPAFPLDRLSSVVAGMASECKGRTTHES